MLTLLSIFAQGNGSQPPEPWFTASLVAFIASISLLFFTFSLLIYIVPLIFIFKKAGHPWFTALIPVYNLYVVAKIIGRNPLIVIGTFIVALLLGGASNGILAFLAGAVTFIIGYDLAKVFGKSSDFSLINGALSFLQIPFTYFVLAFGSDTYKGPLHASDTRWFMESPWVDPDLTKRTNTDYPLDYTE